MGRYSQIGLTTVRAYIDKITTVNALGTTITAANTDGYLIATVYNGGAVAYLSAGSTLNADKIFTITTYSGNTITIGGTTINAGWAVGDKIAIMPKPLAYMCLESESLKENVTWDDTECLQQWEPSYHSAVTMDTTGDLGIFVGSESPALDMVLAAAMGTVTHNAMVHSYYPGASIHGMTVYIMRGNHVSLQCYGGGAVDTLTIDQPAGGNCTGRLTLTGGFGIQEIGGTNKVFTTGPGNFWNPPSVTPDPKRMGFRHLVVSKNTVPETYAESGSITIARNPATERRLGDMFTYDPQSSKFIVTGQLVQWFENDDELAAWRGGHALAYASDPTPFDLQYKWTGTATTGTYLQVDAYDVVWRDQSSPIVAGRIKETVTWQAKFKVAEGASIEIVYANNNYATTAGA
jgi:hypothetical protein